ncbi:hypothetical protein GZH49_23985 [Nocardia terpenica]|uniref:hypothetical protein n=1 Tax=Nocardia terpenica TaxID=455432 RepID=UPI002FDF7588
MNDGEGHWPDELYRRLGYGRRNGVVMTLNWFARYKYAEIKRAPDDSCEFVVIGEDRTDHVYILTDKGRAAAANLNAGYDSLEP